MCHMEEHDYDASIKEGEYGYIQTCPIRVLIVLMAPGSFDLFEAIVVHCQAGSTFNSSYEDCS